MAIVVTSTVSTLEQIHDISTRAVLGGTLLIFCCLMAAGLFRNNSKNVHYVFIVLIGAVALVSGILIASALYVIQNPSILSTWDITL